VVAATTKPTRSIPRAPPVRMADVHSVCGLTDPFCKHSIGAKISDGGRSRTLAYNFHQRVNLPTNGSGNGALLFPLSYLYQPVCVGTVVGSSTSVSYTTFAASNNFFGGATISGYRITSAGFRFRSIASPLNASGMVFIRNFTTKSPALLGTNDIATYNCDDYLDVALQDCRDVVVVPQRFDAMMSKQLTDPLVTNSNNLLSNYVPPGWSVVQIGVIGGPTSVSVLDIEMIVNYEIEFSDSDPMQLAATPTPPVNPIVNDAVNMVSNSVKSIAKTGAESFGKMLAQKATMAIAGLVGGRIGGPSGARAGMMIADAAMVD